MRLLRLWPDDTRFDFMRFRRVSFPFSAAPVARSRSSLFLTDRPEFRHRLQGRHADGAAGEVRQGRRRTRCARPPNAFGFGEVEVQEFGNAGRHLAALPAPARRRGGAERRRAEGARRVRAPSTSSAASRRSGRASRASSCSPAPSASSSRSSPCCSISGSASSGSSRIGAIIGTLHDIVLTIGFFVITRHRVQHDLDRGDPDDRRLFAERDRRGVRPHPRTACAATRACRPRNSSTCRSTRPCRARS